MSAHPVNVLVTVNDREYNIHQVEKVLKGHGLHNTQVMALSGLIGGTAAPESLEDLQQTEGVESVEISTPSYALSE